MKRTPSVLIVTRDEELTGLAERVRAEQISAVTAADRAEVEARLAAGGNWIAVLDAGLPPEETFQIYRLLHGQPPVPTLLVIPEAIYWQFALDSNRSVSDDYTLKPARPDELVFRLKAMILRSGLDLPASAPVPRAHLPEKTGLRNGKVVTVFSVKGGVGKSTIAVNLAVGLRKLFGLSTLIADTDLWFGDVGILLNVVSRNSLSDLCDATEPDIAALQKAVAVHRSGVEVLLRPWDVTAVERLETARIVNILRVCRALYDYVVVDMQPALDELNLQILDVADKILLVTTPEISATANTARFLEIADSLNYTHKISLIVNRSNFGIGIDHIQTGLKTPVAGRVVSAGHVVVDAAIKGCSLFEADPEMTERITQDMSRVVELVAEREYAQQKTPSPWSAMPGHP